MGLNEVKHEIIQNARKEADAILAGARLEAQAIDRKAQAEISDYRNAVEQDTQKLLAAIERREIAGAEFDLKKALLGKKTEMIGAVLERSKKKMQGMSIRKKEEIIRKLVAKAGKEIEVKVVYASKADRAIVSAIKGMIFREADISGGIIAETADGRMRIDCSYGELFDAVKKDNLQQIALLMFGKR